jgi:hypothetical protein
MISEDLPDYAGGTRWLVEATPAILLFEKLSTEDGSPGNQV